MRARRLLAAFVTTGLIAPAAVVAASSGSPAAAATGTQIVSGSEGRGWLKVNKWTSQPGAPVFKKDSISLSINVKTTAGESVYDGSLAVQRRVAGAKAWKTIATASSAYLYKTLDIGATAQYRVLYSGTAEYAPTGAATGAVKVQRELQATNITGRRVGVKGKIAPKAKVKVVVQKKVGKKWRAFNKTRTNKKGRFTVILKAPSRKKTYWRITFKGSKGFAPTRVVYWTRRGF